MLPARWSRALTNACATAREHVTGSGRSWDLANLVESLSKKDFRDSAVMNGLLGHAIVTTSTVSGAMCSGATGGQPSNLAR